MAVTIVNADARRIPLADGVAQCCVTSPPYFALRSYLPAGHRFKPFEVGLEASVAAYVENIVAVGREVLRVLKADGVFWLNLGDSYAGSGKGGQSAKKRSKNWQPVYPRTERQGGVKPKDLIGIPFRVALALQADGWYLRADCIWHKPNPMPESVADRPTKAHEYVFLLTKSARYFYNAAAVREKAVSKFGRGAIGRGNQSWPTHTTGTRNKIIADGWAGTVKRGAFGRCGQSSRNRSRVRTSPPCRRRWPNVVFSRGRAQATLLLTHSAGQERHSWSPTGSVGTPLELN